MSRSATTTTSTTTSTYEATKAAQQTRHFADPIHWHDTAAFRDSSYRQLHHQRGRIGRFHVRLLEAANLQRRYWSALALGPVKHLGLSKAHGAVSSFCTFHLEFAEPHTVVATDGSSSSYGGGNNNQQQPASSYARSSSSSSLEPPYDGHQKPAARINNSSNNHKRAASVYTSPVVPHNDNPVWDSCQFEFPLKKGAMPHDGMRIMLHVSVEEDATAVDQFLQPLVGGGGGSNNNRVIGVGAVDLTELCLGETITGQPLPGVRDAWVDICLPASTQNEDDNGQLQQENFLQYQSSYRKGEDPLAAPRTEKGGKQQHQDDSNNSDDNQLTGMVRLLVSYEPFGLEPQPKDIVALEAFARRHISYSTTCRPVLESLSPLTVLERRGSYLLCEYLLLHTPQHQKVCVRLHRNAVFVIERQNLLDAAHNLALLPVDVVLSTPVGRACQQALGPVAHAGVQLIMPLALSLKLVWMAARTTGLGLASGVHALGTTVWHEGATSLMMAGGGPADVAPPRASVGSGHRPPPQPARSDRRVATAQFVQL